MSIWSDWSEKRTTELEERVAILEAKGTAMELLEGEDRGTAIVHVKSSEIEALDRVAFAARLRAASAGAARALKDYQDHISNKDPAR